MGCFRRHGDDEPPLDPRGLRDIKPTRRPTSHLHPRHGTVIAGPRRSRPIVPRPPERSLVAAAAAAAVTFIINEKAPPEPRALPRTRPLALVFLTVRRCERAAPKLEVVVERFPSISATHHGPDGDGGRSKGYRSSYLADLGPDDPRTVTDNGNGRAYLLGDAFVYCGDSGGRRGGTSTGRGTRYTHRSLPFHLEFLPRTVRRSLVGSPRPAIKNLVTGVDASERIGIGAVGRNTPTTTATCTADKTSPNGPKGSAVAGSAAGCLAVIKGDRDPRGSRGGDGGTSTTTTTAAVRSPGWWTDGRGEFFSLSSGGDDEKRPDRGWWGGRGEGGRGRGEKIEVEDDDGSETLSPWTGSKIVLLLKTLIRHRVS
ncbi:hypothetical protein GWI33_005567 [Rhynchophorus ferrugineus]|uniref:Uncharacterized protein n=1 Tax=Rhynchophorus ferrugineus TaxID=354439 RepID=A0A834MHV9_RHYFE|nr:hypothetical protein GWI33_005567 [Rhynchophorus ferrugineus]